MSLRGLNPGRLGRRVVLYRPTTGVLAGEDVLWHNCCWCCVVLSKGGSTGPELPPIQDESAAVLALLNSGIGRHVFKFFFIPSGNYYLYSFYDQRRISSVWNTSGPSWPLVQPILDSIAWGFVRPGIYLVRMNSQMGFFYIAPGLNLGLAECTRASYRSASGALGVSPRMLYGAVMCCVMGKREALLLPALPPIPTDSAAVLALGVIFVGHHPTGGTRPPHN